MIGASSSTCCLALSSAFSSLVSFPSSPAYDASLASYFSTQEGTLRPTCIVFPQTAGDVALAVKILTETSSDPEPCLFAVRSGGHGRNEGVANIDNGITIDLSNLNGIQISSDRSVVKVGAGNSWDQVYDHLDGLNLTVPGGRASGVGVGGLSLGGGISYLGTRVGWTVDNIVNYEIVLANGSIVEANEDQNADLLWALRGGSNNFGIVTRVDLKAYEQEPFWGGVLIHRDTYWKDQVRQFVDINSANYDEYAHFTLSWDHNRRLGPSIFNNVHYTKSGVTTPDAFADVMSLPKLVNTTRVTTMGPFSRELDQLSPVEQRFVMWEALTMKSTEEALSATWIRFNESMPAVTGLYTTWSFTLQPLPPALYARHASENALGLGDRSEPLAIGMLIAAWADEEASAILEPAGRLLMANIEMDLREMGAYDPFVYLNYAGAEQDPIASYGEDSVQRLKSVARRVDPKGVFTHQVPGGFKLPPCNVA